jgi:NADPH2:quinone reductase
VIDSTFPLADAAGAHRRMDEGGHVGKIVLTVGKD